MTEPQLDQPRSSVKLIRNAKGDPQWEIKVLAGDDEAEITEARRIALSQHNALLRELGVIA